MRTTVGLAIVLATSAACQGVSEPSGARTGEEPDAASPAGPPDAAVAATGGCIDPALFDDDREVHPEPPLPDLPPGGGVFPDPTFGTPILRVTDEDEGVACGVAYSYWPTFNRDGTRLFVSCGSGPGTAFVFALDRAAFALGARSAVFDGLAPSGGYPFTEDAIWSGLDPDVLFVHEGNSLFAYDVTTGEYTLLKRFPRDDEYLWQMSRSIDDNVFAFTRKDQATYEIRGFLAWQRDLDTILLDEDRSNLDEVQVDKSGRFLIVKTGDQGAGRVEVQIADLGEGRITADLTDDSPDFAPGHCDAGQGMVVGADNWSNRYTVRRLDAPHQPDTVISFGDDWSQGDHLSLLADDEGAALLSRFGGPGVGPGDLHEEIFQVLTDGSGRVRRLAHHRSIFRVYEDSPRANISRDGCLVAFTSTWGERDRRDLFVLDLSAPSAATDP